jgi:arginase
VIVEVLGAPIDLGADRRGVDMGPSAIRYAGLVPGIESIGHELVDLGNLPILLAGDETAGSESAKYLPQIVESARSIAADVAGVVTRGHFPLVLGGDHSVGLGSVSGSSRGREIGLIWMDAHGDFNTPETTPSGNVHGMVLAALAGYGEPSMVDINAMSPVAAPRHIALLGVRELDPGERGLLKTAGIAVYTMSQIDHRGIAAVMTDAVAIASTAAAGFHLSLDLDVVDPIAAPGVGTPVPGGLSYREAQLAMEMAGASGRVTSMDVVEVNPILDDHNQTARLAVDLVLSALGKRIL